MFLLKEKCVSFLIFCSHAGVEPGGGRFLGNPIVQLVQSGVWCSGSGGQDMVLMSMKPSRSVLFTLPWEEKNCFNSHLIKLLLIFGDSVKL